MLDALDEFPGAVLLVTHDEQILERVATRLIVFDGGRVTLFEGGYRDFLERVGWSHETDARVEPKRPEGDARALRRKRAALVTERGRATGPLKRRIAKTEAAIERLEREVGEVDAAMATCAEQGRVDELAELGRAAKSKRQVIDETFAELESLSEELDELRARFDRKLQELS
jgi:ATP-binding cassette subfamily F protein 3